MRWEVGITCWIEQDGVVVLDDQRVALLDAIERTGSLTAAAREQRMSYRAAWGQLRESEQRLGARLVIGQSGGAAGGSMVLTPLGMEIVARYRWFRDGLEVLAVQRFTHAFADFEL